jgi:hypothetical protein
MIVLGTGSSKAAPRHPKYMPWDSRFPAEFLVLSYSALRRLEKYVILPISSPVAFTGQRGGDA